MAFDAGSVEASLTVRTDQFNKDMDAAEARVEKFEKAHHEVKIAAVFDQSSMSRARQQFAMLDQQISKDAMSRLRSSPQGSILGALNALFSPHPVTGAPSAQQAATQGLLGKMVSAPGGGGPATSSAGNSGSVVRDVLSQAATAASPQPRIPAGQPGAGQFTSTDTITQKVVGTGPGDVTTTDTVRERLDPASAAKTEGDARASGDRSGRGWMSSFASWVKDLLPSPVTGKAEKDARASGDRSGTSFFAGMGAHLGPFFAGFVKSSGDAGKDGGSAFDRGLAGGIGPGILGVSAKVSGITGAVGSALGALPALAGVAGTGMGVALIGGIVAVVSKGAVAAVQPAVQAFQKLQDAAPGPAQVAALKAYQQQLALLTPAQQGLAKSLEGAQAAWQNFVKSNTAGVAAIVSGGIGLLPGIISQMSGIFQAVVPQMGAVTAAVGGLVQGLLGVARTAVPAFAPFVSAVLGLVTNILPGINVVIKATLPYVSQFAAILGTLGRDLGSLFSTAAPAIGASMQILSGLLGLLGDLLPAVMKIADVFAKALAPVFVQFAGVIRTLIPPLVQIGSVIASFAGAVIGDLASAFGAVAVLIAHLAPSLAILATTLSGVFTILENTGVFAVFGTALENVAVPLAGLVNALVTGLAPILPVLVTALAQMSTTLVGALSAGLTAALTALTPVVAFLAQAAVAVTGFLQNTGLLLPVMAGLGIAFGPVASGLKAMAVGLSLFAGSSFVSGIAGITNAVKGFMIVTEGATAAEKGMLLGEIALNAISPLGWAVIGAVAVTGLVIAFSKLRGGSQDLLSVLTAQDHAVGYNIAGYEKLAGQLTVVADGYKKLSAGQSENLRGLGAQAGRVAQDQLNAQSAAFTQLALNMQDRLTALSATFGVSKTQIEQWAAAAGISEQKFAGAGENVGSLTSKIVTFIDKNAAAITSTASLGTNMTIFGNDVFTASTQLDAFDQIWKILVGDLLTKQEAVTAGQTAFDNLKQSITQSGTASDASKQSFQAYIDQIRSSLDALEKGGASVSDLNGYLQTQIDHLTSLHNLTPGEVQDLDNLRSFQDALANSTHGLTDVQKTLISQFETSLIPDLDKMGADTPKVTGDISNLANSIVQTGSGSASTAADRAKLIADLAEVGVKGKTATDFVNGLTTALKNVPSSVGVRINLSASGGVNAVVTGGTAAIQGGGQLVISTAGGAAGMLVSGGTPGRDSVLAMLMPGEVVVPTAMVQAGAVDHLRGSIPGFAAGGLAGAAGAATFAEGRGEAFTSSSAEAFTASVTAAYKKAAAAAAAAAAGTPVAYSKVAGVTQWETDVSKVLSMLGLPQADLPTVMSQILTESGGNPNAINLTDCLYVDCMILTKRGWLKYDEVQAGDYTIGYNQATGCSEWTRVTRVVYYDDAPLVRIGNKRWSVLATPNHRWLNEAPASQDSGDPPRCTEPGCSWPEGVRRRGSSTAGGYRIHMARKHGMKLPKRNGGTEVRFVETGQIKLSGHYRLRVAAPADTGDGLPVSETEAELLGWVLGDGHIRYAGKTTHRGRTLVTLTQAKPQHVPACRALVNAADPACREYESTLRGGLTSYTWALSKDYGLSLLERSGYASPQQMVLGMSAVQRTAFLRGVMGAEGSAQGRHARIPQVYGDKADAIVLAIFLNGYRPSVSDKAGIDEPHGWSPSGSFGLCRPHVIPLVKEDAGRGAAWCVTTELGTWTARGPDGMPFLTGNSNAAAGTPSKGLLQVIAGTFAAYRNPSLSSNIYDPLANIYAGLNYAVHRYGNPGWLNVLGHGHGYANGGMITEPVIGQGMRSGDRYVLGERGSEMVTPVGGARGGSMSDLAARLDQLHADMREMVSATRAVPAGVGAHVGGALNGAASDASFRARYPRGGA